MENGKKYRVIQNVSPMNSTKIENEPHHFENKVNLNNSLALCSLTQSGALKNRKGFSYFFKPDIFLKKHQILQDLCKKNALYDMAIPNTKAHIYCFKKKVVPKVKDVTNNEKENKSSYNSESKEHIDTNSSDEYIGYCSCHHAPNLKMEKKLKKLKSKKEKIENNIKNTGKYLQSPSCRCLEGTSKNKRPSKDFEIPFECIKKNVNEYVQVENELLCDRCNCKISAYSEEKIEGSCKPKRSLNNFKNKCDKQLFSYNYDAPRDIKPVRNRSQANMHLSNTSQSEILDFDKKNCDCSGKCKSEKANFFENDKYHTIKQPRIQKCDRDNVDSRFYSDNSCENLSNINDTSSSDRGKKHVFPSNGKKFKKGKKSDSRKVYGRQDDSGRDKKSGKTNYIEELDVEMMEELSKCCQDFLCSKIKNAKTESGKAVYRFTNLTHGAKLVNFKHKKPLQDYFATPCTSLEFDCKCTGKNKLCTGIPTLSKKPVVPTCTVVCPEGQEKKEMDKSKEDKWQNLMSCFCENCPSQPVRKGAEIQFSTSEVHPHKIEQCKCIDKVTTETCICCKCQKTHTKISNCELPEPLERSPSRCETCLCCTCQKSSQHVIPLRETFCRSMQVHRSTNNIAVCTYKVPPETQTKKCQFKNTQEVSKVPSLQRCKCCNSCQRSCRNCCNITPCFFPYFPPCICSMVQNCRESMNKPYDCKNFEKKSSIHDRVDNVKRPNDNIQITPKFKPPNKVNPDVICTPKSANISERNMENSSRHFKGEVELDNFSCHNFNSRSISQFVTSPANPWYQADFRKGYYNFEEKYKSPLTGKVYNIAPKVVDLKLLKPKRRQDELFEVDQQIKYLENVSKSLGNGQSETKYLTALCESLLSSPISSTSETKYDFLKKFEDVKLPFDCKPINESYIFEQPIIIKSIEEKQNDDCRQTEPCGTPHCTVNVEKSKLFEPPIIIKSIEKKQNGDCIQTEPCGTLHCKVNVEKSKIFEQPITIKSIKEKQNDDCIQTEPCGTPQCKVNVEKTILETNSTETNTHELKNSCSVDNLQEKLTENVKREKIAKKKSEDKIIKTNAGTMSTKLRPNVGVKRKITVATNVCRPMVSTRTGLYTAQCRPKSPVKKSKCPIPKKFEKSVDKATMSDIGLKPENSVVKQQDFAQITSAEAIQCEIPDIKPKKLQQFVKFSDEVYSFCDKVITHPESPKLDYSSVYIEKKMSELLNNSPREYNLKSSLLNALNGGLLSSSDIGNNNCTNLMEKKSLDRNLLLDEIKLGNLTSEKELRYDRAFERSYNSFMVQVPSRILSKEEMAFLN